MGGKPSAYANEVLEIVAQIPPGKVLTYGDIAELIGRGSGRAVGAAMSRHGHEVAWQRVVLSSGHPESGRPGRGDAAAEERRDPDWPRGGERVDLKAARWRGPETG